MEPVRTLSEIEETLFRGRIIAALKEVYDPELGADVYELGLIYGIDIGESRDVTIRMTLTAPNCPAAQTMPREVERAVIDVEGVKSARVEIVWDPPWTRDKMSEAARFSLDLC